jgi:hypothetical protein
MTVYGNDVRNQNSDPKLLLFHQTRNKPNYVVCTKDNPKMVGFGKSMKQGDIIKIEGTVHNELGFCVSCPDECAFYEYDAFVPADNFYNQ